jgi:hypothetical protein
MREPWKTLTGNAKKYCDEAISRIARETLSKNPEWDAEFKTGAAQSYRYGYENFLNKIIEFADKEHLK